VPTLWLFVTPNSKRRTLVTLIALWKTDDKIQIASDSRLTVGDSVVDTSIKVSSFTARVLYPSLSGMDGERFSWVSEIGFCAAGDIAPSSAIKETLRACMDRIWITPGVGEASMHLFADIVRQLLERLWYDAVAALGNSIKVTLIMAGICPSTNMQRAFVLESDATAAPARIVVSEVTEWEGPLYFGSGAQCARYVTAMRPALSPVEIIEAVCQRQLDPHVGGRVQYGSVQQSGFQTSAVVDIDIDVNERTYTMPYQLGSIELMNPESLALPEGVSLLPRLSAPFERLQAQLHHEGFDAVGARPAGVTLIDGARAREIARQRESTN